MSTPTDTKPDASSATHYVSLPIFDGNGNISMPPEHALQVCVVGDRVFLGICEYQEDAKTTTTTEIAEAVVDTAALLSALVSQLDPDVAEAALLLRRTVR